jgi:hypothetical protein
VKRNITFHQNTTYVIVYVGRPCIHRILSVFRGAGLCDVHNSSFIFTWLALLLSVRTSLGRARSDAGGRDTALQTVRSRVRFPMVSMLTGSLLLWVDSSRNRNEVQEYFLRNKGGWYVELTTLPPSCVRCYYIRDTQPAGTL